MSLVRKTTVCLRFSGEHLDPDEITRLIGKPPTDCERKGETIGGSVKRISKGGGWRFSATDRNPGDIDAQFAEIFDNTTNDLAVWRHLSATHGGDVFCGVFLEEGNQGLCISPKSLLTLGERGLTIDFDLYGPIGSS